jgi:hypothetical protein
MDDPVRLTKLPSTNITRESSTQSSEPVQEKKELQQGIAAAKDSFEVITSESPYSINLNKGEVIFGDGIQGETPATGTSNIQARYQSGSGLSGNYETDPNALVQHVLRESYLQTTEDLKSYAEKVKYFNEMKKEVRGFLQETGLTEASTRLDGVTAGKESNVMEQLYSVMRESIQDTNEDKKYYLGLLDKMNKTSSEISAQFEAIAKASTSLSTKKKDDDD